MGTPTIEPHPVQEPAAGPAAAARPLLQAASSAYERLGAVPGHRAVQSRLLALA